MNRMILLFLLAMSVLASCTAHRKLGKVREGNVSATLALPLSEERSPYELSTESSGSDTLVVKDLEGRDVFIMKAVRDTASGEMVAADFIQAAVVVARFRNVAERGGKVNVAFQLQVPQVMLDSRWQIRLFPTMTILEDTVALDAVSITGRDYRRVQLRGYERYSRFVNSIVTDTTRFIDRRHLDVFIRRNIPQLDASCGDTGFVSGTEFRSEYGISSLDAAEHYTDKLARWINNTRKRMSPRIYSKYVKVPIGGAGLRLDTVIQTIPEIFDYNYTETVATRPHLRKVEISLEGGIWEEDRELYHMKASEPLTFYISSLTSFVDETPRFLDKVVERHAEASDVYEIVFPVNGTDLDLSIGGNRTEISAIKARLRGLMSDAEYDLDSIVVTASASPEGAWRQNDRLSRLRSRNICRYFERYIKDYRDSCRLSSRLSVESGFSVNLDDSYAETPAVDTAGQIRFVSRSEPENWGLLGRLVDCDTVLSISEKDFYHGCAAEPDMDGRELRLRRDKGLYSYLRGTYYGKCRNVVFNFNMHRRQMTKDTIHTTIPDERYAEGVRFLKDHDYEAALEILAPYGDYNAALAYSLLDRNASSLSILENLERNAEVNYLLAVVLSRQGRVDDALRCYLAACSQNGAYRHRGNLDPEIFPLIKTYGLFREEDAPSDI